MHFSLAYTITAAIFAVVFPSVNAQGTLPDGTYRLENLAFDSFSPKRVLDLNGAFSDPGTPLISFANGNANNQHWRITTFGPGYNLQAVAPPSNAFVASLSAGAGVTGTPNDKSTFLFNKVSADDIYQVIVASDNGTFAIQSTTDGAPCTLGLIDATDPHQTWRLVAV